MARPANRVTRSGASAAPRALAATIACAALACVVDAPIAHRADERASYASKYFRVDAPSGAGWEAVVRTAEHPFAYERGLFTPWVPARVGFVLHAWRELWPHSEGGGPTVEFSALPAAPGGASTELERELSGAMPRGELDLGELRWRVFEDARVPVLRSAVLVAEGAGIVFSVRMQVPEQAAELPPPELARVVAGFHRERVAEAAESRAIERGVAALHRLASDSGWSGGWDAGLEREALTGIETLARTHRDRYEAPLFEAALALLRGRSELTRRGGGSFEPVGPFEIALESAQGHVSTTSLSADYDAREVARLLGEATTRAPDSFWARYHLGTALARSGDLNAALLELMSLAERYPESALAWFALALVQRDAGEVPAALSSARRAIAANAQREVFARYGTGLFGSTRIDALVKELRR